MDWARDSCDGSGRFWRCIERADWERLEAAVLKANFWALEPIEGRMGLDGADWVIEGRRRNVYRAVTRWSPSGAIYDLGRTYRRAADRRYQAVLTRGSYNPWPLAHLREGLIPFDWRCGRVPREALAALEALRALPSQTVEQSKQFKVSVMLGPPRAIPFHVEQKIGGLTDHFVEAYQLAVERVGVAVWPLVL